VGLAVARVLEKLGHSVEFRSAQTCCGQPSFNSGYWDEARAVAIHALKVFAGAEAVVGPSGSCVAMMRVFSASILRCGIISLTYLPRPSEFAVEKLVLSGSL
jgi:L-lactate dehydrogenase complex protein LldE